MAHFCFRKRIDDRTVTPPLVIAMFDEQTGKVRIEPLNDYKLTDEEREAFDRAFSRPLAPMVDPGVRAHGLNLDGMKYLIPGSLEHFKHAAYGVEGFLQVRPPYRWYHGVRDSIRRKVNFIRELLRI